MLSHKDVDKYHHPTTIWLEEECGEKSVWLIMMTCYDLLLTTTMKGRTCPSSMKILNIVGRCLKGGCESPTDNLKRNIKVGKLYRAKMFTLMNLKDRGI